jgi:tetratricopeptide (TPR) repeat protein
MARYSGQKDWEIIILYNSLDIMNLVSRKYEDALSVFDRALGVAVELGRIGYQRIILSLKGLAYLGLNKVDNALKVAEELRDLCQQFVNKRLIRIYPNLIGMIELKREDYASAIESIKKAISLDPNVFKNYIDSLALAYYQSGDLDNARTEYEKVISCPRGMMEYGLEYVNSFYILGKIHEQQGDSAKAIEHYEKFLDLWKDADPGIAEVEDARKRLAGLKSPS